MVFGKVISVNKILSKLDKESADKLIALLKKRKTAITLATLLKKLDKETAKKIKVIAENLPSENYPPAWITSAIQICKAKSRPELGSKMLEWWNSHILVKYPKTRINWPTANVMSFRSIQKNIFKYKYFSGYLQENGVVLNKEEVSAYIKMGVPKDQQAKIEIPTEKETPEMWQQEEKVTQSVMQKTENAFSQAQTVVQIIEQEIQEFERKIKDYSPGGAKYMTKKGKPHAFSERVDDWKAIVAQYTAQIAKLDSTVKQSQQDFQNSKAGYNHAPVTTIAYEKKAQKVVTNIDAYLQKLVKEKNWNLLAAIIEDIKQGEKIAASTEEIDAGILDFLAGLFKKLVSFVKEISKWIKDLLGATADFHEVAFKVGR